MGGKLGDFLHSMFAVKQLSTQFDIKANIHMLNFGWERSVEQTHSELSEIFNKQEYVESFDILYDCDIDPIQRPEQNSPVRVKDQQILKEGYTDLGNFLRSPLLYNACWSEIYANTFGFDIKDEYAWVKWDGVLPDFENKVVIHRRYNPVRINNDFPYNTILENYGDDVIFVSSDENDYNQFNFKKLPFVKIESLEMWFSVINSCGLFISNLTGPAVIGHSLDKNRIIELPNIVDSKHCIGEEKYSNNINWFVSHDWNTMNI